MHRRTLLFVLAALAPATAHAVFVRGKVTSPLGVPVAYARVQLIQGTRSVGEGIAGPDGSYEIRSGLSGRFLLLTSRGAMVQIGEPFYGGALDLVSKDILLAPGAIYPASSASLPVRPLSSSAQQLGAWTTLMPELAPAAFQVQQGPVGSPAYVLVQGAAPSATQIRIDDVSAEDLGDASTSAPSALRAFSLISRRPRSSYWPRRHSPTPKPPRSPYTRRSPSP